VRNYGDWWSPLALLACLRMPAELTAQQLQEPNRFQRLRAAVELTVSDLSVEIGSITGVRISPEVVATLAELTVDKAQRTAQDLEAFAQHAKRSNITGEDVKLLTRRNPQLNSHIAALQQREQSSKPKTSSKSTKTKRKDENLRSEPGGSKSTTNSAFKPLID